MVGPCCENQAEKPLNESPSEKEGKCHDTNLIARNGLALNESPSEKEGK